MSDWNQLHAGRVTDIRTTATRRRRWWQFEPAGNALLGRFGSWRLGRSDGRRALLHVVPPYRQIILWPRAKR